jgi:dibenzofuran dioxygenase subunit alpha
MQPHELVDLENGLIAREIFFSETLYRQELERIFARSWLFLGHVSQIPERHDFFTNYMGEDPVVVLRDEGGRVRVFLNSCPHRGMRLCRLDSGNAARFTCSFHGWTFSSEGALVGVPFFKEAYHEALDRDAWGLAECPLVATYGGLIFACWDTQAGSLDDYLGDIRWYLDIVLERVRHFEVIPGLQRYTLDANWKIAAENFTGDTYHVPFSHGSVFQLEARTQNPVNWSTGHTLHTVRFEGGHGMTGIEMTGARYDTDLAIAATMGAEVVEYVEEGQRRLTERLGARQAKIYNIGFGNVFPNFSINSFSAFGPIGLYLWHPRGAGTLESWGWCAFDRDAPQVMKDHMRIDFARNQAAAGVIAQDDTENFEQVTQSSRGVIGRRRPFNYQMGLGRETAHAMPGYPGQYLDYYSEAGQRGFYDRWAQLMEMAS